MFRLLGDAGHGAHGLHGIFARGAFARKHDGGGAVKNGVGNVGDLRARGAGTDDHRFKHLRGGDDHLARLIAAADEALLQAGQAFVGDFHAHVAAGDHDAVAVFEDFVEMIDALFVFDFGNDADCMAAVIIEELAHVNDVLGGAHKGGGDEIHVMFDAKEQVALVLFAQIGHGQMHAGDVDALARGNFAAADNAAVNIGIRRILDQQVDAAVVDEDGIAFLELGRECGIGDRADGAAAGNGAGSEGEITAGLHLSAAVFHFAQADFGTFGIEQDGGGNTQTIAHAAEAIDHFLVRFMCAVRKIKTGHIHAAAQHFFHNGLAGAGGA